MAAQDMKSGKSRRPDASNAIDASSGQSISRETALGASIRRAVGF